MAKRLLKNAKFYTLKNQKDYYNALLIENGIIKQTYKKEPDFKNIKKIDLGSSYVYPGFIDTHTHSFEGGLYSMGTNLAAVKTINQALSLIENSRLIDGKIFAFHYDENLIDEKRFPTREELDRIFPENPVILRRVDGHSCVINSKAAKEIKWNSKLSNSFNGYLNGRLNDIAANWFHHNLEDESIIRAYQEAAKIAIQSGHTTIHTMIGNGYQDPEHYKLIRDNPDKFPIEFIIYPQIVDINKALELGAPRIGGCILADGSFGSHTAALKEPYKDQPNDYGNLYHTDKFWQDLIGKAHANKLQVAVHAIGDAAIEQILKAYEKANRKSEADLRHQIIHNELTDDDMLHRMKKAKISAVMQPMFNKLWGGDNDLYEKVLGKSRTKLTNRFAAIMKRNILLTGGSDWYVTAMDALQGIEAAVNHHNPAERLSRLQALQIYTHNAAKLSFDENRLGLIKEGFQADMVCLDKDLFVNKDILNIEIKYVIKKGQIVRN